MSHGKRITKYRMIQLLTICYFVKFTKRKHIRANSEKNEFNYTIKAKCFIYMAADIMTVCWCLRPFLLCEGMSCGVAKCTRTTFSNSASILASVVFRRNFSVERQWSVCQWVVFVGQVKVFFWLHLIRESESALVFCLQVGEGRKRKSGRNTSRAKTFASHSHYPSVITTRS